MSLSFSIMVYVNPELELLNSYLHLYSYQQNAQVESFVTKLPSMVYITGSKARVRLCAYPLIMRLAGMVY